LLEIWTISQILWIDAATFLVAVGPLLVIKIPAVVEKEDALENRSSFKMEFKEGLAFIKNGRGFLTFILLATALNCLLTPTNLLPYFVRNDHLGEVSDLAFVSASFQGGMLAGGIVMSVIKGFKISGRECTGLTARCIKDLMTSCQGTGVRRGRSLTRLSLA